MRGWLRPAGPVPGADRAAGGGGQHHVGLRLSASRLPVAGLAADSGGEFGGAEALGAAEDRERDGGGVVRDSGLGRTRHIEAKH